MAMDRERLIRHRKARIYGFESRSLSLDGGRTSVSRTRLYFGELGTLAGPFLSKRIRELKSPYRFNSYALRFGRF